jgi:HEAT repeats
MRALQPEKPRTAWDPPRQSNILEAAGRFDQSAPFNRSFHQRLLATGGTMMRNSAWYFAAIIALLLCMLARSDARADIFVLDNDGRVEGTLTNPKESPRKQYIVKTDEGAIVTLDKSQVKDHVLQSPDEIEYEKIRFTFLDTVDGQWKAAEWCRDRGLTRQRNTHLERIIELDMNHKAARAALGYGQINGKWVRPEDVMKARGYVLHKGRWLLPQDKALQEQKEQAEFASKEWYNKIRRFRGLVGDRGPKGQAALDELQAITDPNAVPALMQWFKDENSEAVSLEIIKVLGRIERGDAVRSLCLIAVEGASEELRLSAIDELKRIKDHSAVTMLVQALKSKDNKRINRAGLALGELADKSAIEPLIASLVTVHKRVVQQGGGPNSITTGFDSTGGTSFGTGSKAVVVRNNVSNQDVHDALVKLAGDGVDFGYDTKAWRVWHANQKKPPVNAGRRD